MKERPIIFNAWSIQAILEGRKTMTRRVIKPQPIIEGCGAVVGPEKWLSKEGRVIYNCDYEPSPFSEACPHGQPGDRLWVQETWRQRGGGGKLDGTGEYVTIEYRASATTTYMGDYDEITYARERRSPPDIDHSKSGMKWHPSIFMPRWASRITVEIVDVQARQIQQIDREDCINEGLQPWENMKGDVPLGYYRSLWGHFSVHPDNADPWGDFCDAEEEVVRDSFGRLWDSIHIKPKRAKRNPYTWKHEDCWVSYPWENIRETRTKGSLPWYVVGNPWAWCISFNSLDKHTNM